MRGPFARKQDQASPERRLDALTNAIAACRQAILAVGTASLFINVLMLTVPLYMLQIYDRVLTSRSEETLLFLTLATLTALAVFGVLDMLRGRIMIRASTWIERRIGPEALERSVESQLLQRTYAVQAMRDLAQVRQFLANPAIFSLFDAPWVPVYLAVIYLLHPVLGWVALAAALVLFGLALVNEIVTRTPLRAANEKSLTAMRQTEATVRNAHVIESMGMMPGVIGRWFAGNDESLLLQQVSSERAGMLLALSKFLRLGVQALILGVGAYLVIDYSITAGTMIAASIILSRALQPIEQAISTWRYLLSARAAHHRLRVFFAQPPARVSEIRLPRPEGHLSVEQVTFVPPGAPRPSILGVSFALGAGETLAVIGPSAAGKSTLARLIVGSWKPYGGVVRLDGADVFTWERSDFGKHVGYMPQEVELFEGTIAENISRLGDADADEVVAAARRAGAHEMILRLPEGYRTRLGESGQSLSGGQRQRIALARAMFGAPRLVVLDEPNSNLDADGEEALIRAITQLKADRATIVLVAHRPRFVALADKVLFLRNGAAEMFGPREQILPKILRPVPVSPSGEAPVLGAPGRPG
jgi:ATP-binding cassette subfamily C protein/ATP-binding cassette subfamily C protein EexD